MFISIDKKITCIHNNSLWTSRRYCLYHCLMCTNVLQACKYFLLFECSSYTTSLLQKTNTYFGKVFFCNSKNLLQNSFSLMKICTNIKFHNMQLAELNLHKVGDTYNVFLCRWFCIMASLIFNPNFSDYNTPNHVTSH